MRICLNKKQDNRLTAVCKRVKKEGESLCKNCVYEPWQFAEKRSEPVLVDEQPIYYNPRTTAAARNYGTTAYYSPSGTSTLGGTVC